MNKVGWVVTQPTSVGNPSLVNGPSSEYSLIYRPDNRIRGAAVDRQCGAGGEPRRWAGEIERGADYLMGFTSPLQRERVSRPLGEVLSARPPFAHVGVERAADDTVHPHLGSILFGTCDCQDIEPRF